MLIIAQVTRATTLWWNAFTVLDILLLLVYDQLRSQLGPKPVFYVNNVIWFLGLDLYHLYFTLALWTHGVPSIKEVPQVIAFYPLKPTNLEPRRPKLDNNDTDCAAEDQNPNQIEELRGCNATCEFWNHSLDKPGWKGKGGKGVRKRKVTGEKEPKTGDTEPQGSLAKTKKEKLLERINQKPETIGFGSLNSVRLRSQSVPETI